EVFAAQAQALGDDPYRSEKPLHAALAAARRAQSILDSGEPADDLRRGVAGRLEALRQADRDRRLLVELDDIRLRQADVKGGRFLLRAAAPRYEKAFAGHGWDVKSGPAAVAERARRHPLKPRLLAGLRDWLRVSTDRAEQQRLLAVLSAAEPAPD